MDDVRKMIALIQKLCTQVEKATDQITLIKEELRVANVRLRRAQDQRRMAQIISYELQMQTIQGVYCMYIEYVERKMAVVRRIKIALRQQLLQDEDNLS